MSSEITPLVQHQRSIKSRLSERVGKMSLSDVNLRAISLTIMLLDDSICTYLFEMENDNDIIIALTTLQSM